MRQLLYATTNPGKLMEARQLFDAVGIVVRSPADVGLMLDVDEIGRSLEENAILKARAYLDQLDGGAYVVVGDDTGIEIDALGGEPGIHSRRWTGERMTDEAIITTCLQRMEGIPPAQRGAQFRTVFAVGTPGSAITLFDGTLRGVILEQADPLRIEGFPFESIFYVPEWEMLLGAAQLLPAAEKLCCATHRERALRAALPFIRELLAG